MRGRAGFSLVEVVIAVGVFAVGVTAIVGVLPGLLREQEAAEATLTALRLPDAVQSELRRISRGDVGALRLRLAEPGGGMTEALRLVADRGGGEVREFSSGDEREQYFLVELFRFPAGSPAEGLVAGVAIRVRVSWPFRVGVGTARVEVPTAEREDVEFNVVLNR